MHPATDFAIKIVNILCFGMPNSTLVTFLRTRAQSLFFFTAKFYFTCCDTVCSVGEIFSPLLLFWLLSWW